MMAMVMVMEILILTHMYVYKFMHDEYGVYNVFFFSLYPSFLFLPFPFLSLSTQNAPNFTIPVLLPHLIY